MLRDYVALSWYPDEQYFYDSMLKKFLFNEQLSENSLKNQDMKALTPICPVINFLDQTNEKVASFLQ